LNADIFPLGCDGRLRFCVVKFFSAGYGHSVWAGRGSDHVACTSYTWRIDHGNSLTSCMIFYFALSAVGRCRS
jgi:hypothetical protein